LQTLRQNELLAAGKKKKKKDACLFPVVAFKSKYDVLSINIGADVFPQRPMAFNTGFESAHIRAVFVLLYE
jgi:hypothetical protein